MSPRLRIAALVALTLAVPGHAPLAAARPNVLFFFTDDQRADTIGALGNPHVVTPTLDRLAESGFVFRNAYVMGSNVGAVCLPSRNMLLSGRAYFRFHADAAAGKPTRAYASPEKPNFPDSMKQAGYLTYHHGKQGNVARLIHPRFDHSRYVQHYALDPKAPYPDEPGKEIVDAAIEFLTSRRDDRPFFLYLAPACPHDPRVAADRYMRRYDRRRIPLPENYLPLHPFDNGEQVIRDELLAPWPRTPEEIRKHLHEYYAVITAMDGHFGRLLQTLKELGEYENTIIIFSSDNGLAVGSHGLMGKQNLYEHSSKVPLVFAGPGIPQGQSDALVYLLDVYPTVCDLLGAPIPEGLDGKSLAPVIRGRAERVRDTLFTAYRDGQRAVRDDRWKLIRYPLIHHTQLFDLAADPHEMHNLADDPAQAERIERMTGLIRQWQAQLGDHAPLASAAPGPFEFVPPTGDELDAILKRWRMDRNRQRLPR